jgi:hypothetical protein
VGLAINGVDEPVTGLRTVSCLAAPEWRLQPTDYRTRVTHWVRSIILHTTQGIHPQIVHEGAGAGGRAIRTLHAWSSDDRCAGAHLIVDTDGAVYCMADIIKDTTYHATSINEVSVGVEIVQSPKGEIWAGQLAAVLRLCDFLTQRLQIQRQFHAPYVRDKPVGRLARGGFDAVGIFGHRDQTDRRGRGDPGDAIFALLRSAGYEAFDFEQNADLAVWRERQKILRLRGAFSLAIDGVPGRETAKAIREHGSRASGIWVRRPHDLEPTEEPVS